MDNSNHRKVKVLTYGGTFGSKGKPVLHYQTRLVPDGTHGTFLNKGSGPSYDQEKQRKEELKEMDEIIQAIVDTTFKETNF